MQRLTSKYFGEMDYQQEAVFEFPSGIPGFESYKSFVFLEQEHTLPLVFMQSLADAGLCFIAVPVHVADTAYRLELAAEDRLLLQMPVDLPIQVGMDVLCLALVTASEGSEPTANLASPIVLNLGKRIGIQAISETSGYSSKHPLLADEEATLCS
jgi:flagellar assembly factor FliW